MNKASSHICFINGAFTQCTVNHSEHLATCSCSICTPLSDFDAAEEDYWESFDATGKN